MLKDLLAGALRAQIAAYITAENPLPTAVESWLTELALLQNVPFNNLVTDEQLLPSETLRLFYLDKNWTDAAMDGALSIGIHSERDSLLQEAVNDLIRKQTARNLATVTQEIGDTKTFSGVGTMSGLLMRSAIVTNYKGLEINAFADTDGTQPLRTLRMQRLAADVLLVLFESVPALIEFKSPSENRTLSLAAKVVTLRRIEGEVGAATGETLKIESSEFKNSQKRVLNIGKLQQKMAKALQKNELSPAEFGLQLMQSPKVFQLLNDDLTQVTARATAQEIVIDAAADKAKLLEYLKGE